ncbi:elongation factor G [Pseudonocardia spinosispora]|uniref:elongation factor G n=1 Tax=Pseudonocardia spinosispora TaxID=103441 RepID=UPI00042311D2|nr:TetM/TetW/TetO/TetS family tetracycline resistance ribosomal protection protein [Pseudonocardia spinosispora]
MALLNVGILAHVDAGKTSLTERLLFDAGVLDRLGRVDHGTTRTDSSDLERARGITINSAVVSFTLGDVTVNLIDTPGHPDFIAEVRRSLRVLDGVVLVVSSVEGVQAQTRVLMRALARLRIPTLLFVNKIDRVGARYEELIADISSRLSAGAVAMNAVVGLGTRDARTVPLADSSRLTEVLAEHDDELLADYLTDRAPAPGALRRSLAQQCTRALVHPVYFGSAITGAGIAELVTGLRELLPSVSPTEEGAPPTGTVFKIETVSEGEKVAYLRMRTGSVSVRDRLSLHRIGRSGEVSEHSVKVTGIEVFRDGAARRVDTVGAPDIGRLHGVEDVRIGDSLGPVEAEPDDTHFSPPTLETVIRPRFAHDGPRLSAALRRLAERDPLIDLREEPGETSLRLYGEVQREVIQSQLELEFGVSIELAATRTVHLEKLLGTSEAVRAIDKRGANEFFATIGLRLEPGPAGSGVRYRLDVELGSLPAAFHTAIEQSVRAALRRGLYGWEVTDCLVTLTRSGFASPISTAGDFRDLAPILLADALRRSGTAVYEPVSDIELEVPPDTLGAVLGTLGELGASTRTVHGAIGTVEGTLPTAHLPELRRRLPSMTRGEGMLLDGPAGHRPVHGPPPRR